MPRSVAIMQPTYLPWIGYFGLMARVDIFVLLDSVQFARRSWQQRNRIKTPAGEKMLTVPVIKKGLRDQSITEVVIDGSQDMLRKHWATIAAAYRLATYFGDYAAGLQEILESEPARLIDINLGLIDWLRGQFGIDTALRRSSEMEDRGSKADRLAVLCDQLGAGEYISPPGSREYLEASAAFADRGIAIRYHEYRHPRYPQLHGEFLPYMAAIDLLFNHGPQSRATILSGNR